MVFFIAAQVERAVMSRTVWGGRHFTFLFIVIDIVIRNFILILITLVTAIYIEYTLDLNSCINCA